MSEHVIEVEKLTRRFGRKIALEDVTLSIPRGCVFGLVGENGAGKTTLIRHILGLLKAQTGHVRVFALDPVTNPVEVLGRIGYLSEDRDLPEWMRIRELLRYTQAFYPQWDEGYASQLVTTFELDPEQKIKTLSRGQRARAGLLIALAHRPDLLLLDEPSSGLDPIVRQDILSAIIRTVADEGRTVVFSSHLLDEVQRVADHVAMIHVGQVVLSAPLDNILADHHVLTFRFDSALSHAPSLPGALSVHGEEVEWTLVCNGSRERTIAAAEAMGGNLVDERAVSLEEIFVARAKQ